MSQALIDAHRAELADIQTLLEADLAAQWQARVPATSGDLMAVRREATAVAVDLVDYYGTMAAGAGADWYEELRYSSGATGRFTARTVVPLVREQVEGNVGYALGSLYGATDARAAAELASRAALGGALQRLVTNAERETVLANVRRDPEAARWYRHARPDACAFCVLAASRGAVYRSEATGGFKAHDHCRCLPVPLFRGDSAPDYYADFMDDYQKARKALVEAGDEAPRMKPVLAKMRELTGRK